MLPKYPNVRTSQRETADAKVYVLKKSITEISEQQKPLEPKKWLKNTVAKTWVPIFWQHNVIDQVFTM